tara:strand:+ start:207 stop:2054 length:1848 start_codon:yes stop_codon:yes gene_type:complete
MDVLMPDGTLVKDVPEGTTKAQLEAKLAGSVAPKTTTLQPDVPLVASQMPKQVPIETKTSMADKLKALYEVPATIGSAMVSQPTSMLYGVGRSAIDAATQGTAPSGEARDAYYRQARQATQFQPTSPASIGALESIGGALETSKLPPYLGNIGAIPSAIQSASAVRPMVNQAIQNVRPAVNTMAQALRKEAPTMAGVGAAEVPEAVTRVQMASQLRVPGTYSKGQATKDLGQQKFEIETPKNFPELGKPLIEEQAKRNDIILQNFDAYVDATGKETYGLRETGRVVDKALVGAANKAKADINKAYTAARDAGETQQPVSYAPLKAYIDEQTPTVKRKLAPIISAVEEEIAKNDPKNKTGQISINNLEDIYQFINKNYEPGTVGEGHAKTMKNLINQMTEGQGGELYQEARKLRTKYGREFENVGYVDKLLRTKPGTTDRSVAYEDVFDHAILNGSLDDVRAIGMTLKKSGPEGQQAFKELQGQTIQYIKDKVSQSVDVDSFGNPVVSPAKFKSVVTQLDQDGKLDYLFGKSGAEEIRNLLEYTINVNAPLKGAANYSNTSSAIIGALDKIGAIRIPGVSNVAKFAAEKGKESALNKQIQESINYNPMADALRKTK